MNDLMDSTLIKPGTIVRVTRNCFSSLLKENDDDLKVWISTDVNNEWVWSQTEDVQIPANSLCMVTAVDVHHKKWRLDMTEDEKKKNWKFDVDLILIKYDTYEGQVGEVQVVKLEKVRLDIDDLFDRTDWKWNLNIIEEETEYGVRETIQKGTDRLQLDTENCEYTLTWLAVNFADEENGIVSSVDEDHYSKDYEYSATTKYV